ncbi:MAG TPA: hypothetical protein VIN38_03505 [Thiobacillus sp.]
MTRIRQQIQANLVAIISLLVALSALSYTAWRQEQTEDNRTQRVAAFSMLQTAEELQSVVDFAHYDNDLIAGNPIKGWGKVLYLRDLGIIMPSSIQVKTQFLQAAWAQNWQAMHQDEAAAQRITAAIESLRGEVRALLVSLQ